MPSGVMYDHMDAKEALKVYFGYDSYKPGQEEIMKAILSERDVLAIMPTGAGKSACYQVPAMLLPGITVVISPLISLMQDQVKALNEAGIHAGYINSSGFIPMPWMGHIRSCMSRRNGWKAMNLRISPGRSTYLWSPSTRLTASPSGDRISGQVT